MQLGHLQNVKMFTSVATILKNPPFNTADMSKSVTLFHETYFYINLKM